jgi:hypothetical protein
MSTDHDLRSDGDSTDNLLLRLAALHTHSEQRAEPEGASSAKTRAELPESFGAWREARRRRVEQQISLLLDAAE